MQWSCTRTPHSDPVYKITIIPRGQMGGFTMSLPEQDSLLMSRNQILARITGLMGGRVAEELFCDDITSGAANDLKVATQLAEEMVMRLGMSETGLRVFNKPEGYEAMVAPRTGQRTFEALDQAINRSSMSATTKPNALSMRKARGDGAGDRTFCNRKLLSREEFVCAHDVSTLLAV
jgi:ATP-dependent Zn protease